MAATGAHAAALTSFDALAAQTRSRFDTLSPSHQLLAERVVADPEAVALMTISAVAKVVGVDEATVVRFSGGLGLKGYPGLTRLCRARS